MQGENHTETCRLWLDDDGVLRVVVINPISQTTEHARDNMRVLGEIGGGLPRPTIIDNSQMKGLSREARAIYSGHEAAAVMEVCALVVTTSLIARALGNFVITVSRPAFPTRLFESTDDALVWARSFLRKG
jgi:hypothetical protein